MNRIKPFLHYLLAYRFQIMMGIGALLVTDLAGLTIPWLIKTVIDFLPDQPSGLLLAQFAGWLLLAALVQGVSRFGWRKFLFGTSRKIEVDILNDLFAHFMTLDQTFFQKQQIGDLMSRGTNDLRAVKEFLGLGLLVVVDAVVVILACVSLMVYINPELALITLLPLPLVSLLFFGFIRAISIRHTAIQEHLAKITSMVQENLAGIRVLHAFVQEENEIKKFDGLNREHIEKNMRLARLFAVFTPSLVLTTGTAALLSLWIGSKEVIAGELTLGSFVAFNSYLVMLSWPMMAIGFVVNLTQKGLSAMSRLQEIFDARSSLDQVTPVDPDFKIEGAIEFRGLHFTYPEAGQPVLQDVDFVVQPGSSLALVGMIGSGKSSLVQLIPRIFEVARSTLWIDGKPIQEIPPDLLRRSIGYVEQEPFLFSTTIRENIAMGRPGSSAREIEEMVRCVHLLPDLERWPLGLDTLVGERGVSLSGGQKQRIALARALIRRPKILILDDAFSSLDTETEAIILDNMPSYIEGTTTLMITHRLSMVQKVDQILVLDGGRVVERGTHGELMRLKGAYQQLFVNQALAREMEIMLQ